MQIKINVDLMKLQAIGENLLLICLSVTFYTLLTSTKSCFIREFLLFFFFAWAKEDFSCDCSCRGLVSRLATGQACDVRAENFFLR